MSLLAINSPFLLQWVRPRGTIMVNSLFLQTTDVVHRDLSIEYHFYTALNLLKQLLPQWAIFQLLVRFCHPSHKILITFKRPFALSTWNTYPLLHHQHLSVTLYHYCVDVEAEDYDPLPMKDRVTVAGYLVYSWTPAWGWGRNVR